MVKAIIFGSGLAGWLTSVIFVAAASPGHQLSDRDKSFLAAAAILSNYELRASKIAQHRVASDSDRSDAAFLMIEDTRIIEDMQAIADQRGAGFRLPAGVDAAHRRMLVRLQDCRSTFAAEYATQMAASHLAMQALYRDYLRRDDADNRLKAVISSALPTVAIHLQEAKALAERQTRTQSTSGAL